MDDVELTERKIRIWEFRLWEVINTPMPTEERTSKERLIREMLGRAKQDYIAAKRDRDLTERLRILADS